MAPKPNAAAAGANAAQAAEEEAKRRAEGEGVDWVDLTPEQRKKKIEKIHEEKANYAGVYDFNFADNPGQKAWIAKLFAKLNDEQRQRVLNDFWYNNFLADKGVGRMLLTNLFANPDQMGGILLGLLFKKMIQWGSAYRLNKLAAMIDAEAAGIQAGKGKDEKFDAQTKAKDPNQSLSLGEIGNTQKAEIEKTRDKFWKDIQQGAEGYAPGSSKIVEPIKKPEQKQWIEEQRVKAYQALDAKVTDADPIGRTLTGQALSISDRVKGFLETFKKSLNSNDCPFEDPAARLTAARMVIGDLGTTDDAKLLLDDIENKRKKDIGEATTMTEASAKEAQKNHVWHQADEEEAREIVLAQHEQNIKDGKATEPLSQDELDEQVTEVVAASKKIFDDNDPVKKYLALKASYPDLMLDTQLEAIKTARIDRKIDPLKEQLRTIKNYAIAQDARHGLMRKLCTDYAENGTDSKQMLDAYQALEAALEDDSDPKGPALLLNKKFIADQKKSALIEKMKEAANQGGVISFDETKVENFGANPSDYKKYSGTDTAPGASTQEIQTSLDAKKAQLDAYFKDAKAELDGFVKADLLTDMEARKAYYRLAADHNKLHQQRFEAATRARESDSPTMEDTRRKLISPKELIVSAGITTKEFVKLKAAFDPLQKSLDEVKEKIAGFEKAEEELKVHDKVKYPKAKDWTAAKTKVAEDKKAELAKQKEWAEKIDKLFCPEDEKALKTLGGGIPEGNATRQDIEAILRQHFSKPAAGPTAVPTAAHGITNDISKETKRVAAEVAAAKELDEAQKGKRQKTRNTLEL